MSRIYVCKYVVNKEFLVTVPHQGMVNVSLFFVHTARHYFRWS